MGCKSPHARAARTAASREPRARARAHARARVLVLGLGSWQLVFGWSLGLVMGLVLGLDPRLVV